MANRAAEQTGIGPAVLKQMLPVVAAMVMGALSKQTALQQSTGARDPQAEPAGALGMVTRFLDFNRDGSAADDILGIAGKLFGGR